MIIRALWSFQNHIDLHRSTTWKHVFGNKSVFEIYLETLVGGGFKYVFSMVHAGHCGHDPNLTSISFAFGLRLPTN